MENNENLKDERLWKIAKKRADFKHHLVTYLLVNAFIWTIWIIRSNGIYSGHIWPVYVSLGWGIGLGMNFFSAYFGIAQAEKEYQKLLSRNHQSL